ncbi:MAG: hypothetical protein AAFO69_08680 [Bacteroidota bacterium]
MKFITTIVLLLVFLTNTALAQKSESVEMAMALLKKYSPDGHYVITQATSVPGKYKFGDWTYRLGPQLGVGIYVTGTSNEKIVESLSTAVHEMTHSYTHRLVYQTLQEQNRRPARDAQYMVIHIKGTEKVLVKETETFISRALNNAIPKHLRTMRFDTYINTRKEILGTQKSGIYGLLNEFSAYYHDSQTSYDLYEYYMQETDQRNADYLAYMSGFYSGFYAYVEFKHYILSYLLFAQDNHPDIYEGIMSNQAFKRAFLETERLYAEVIQDYFNRNEQIEVDLRSRGETVRFEEETTWIGNSGVGNFMKEYNLLKTELEREEYVQMMKLLRQ